jgi:uncharacterized membrane protein YdjX (TVP38/TMEM64 family)
MLAHRNNVLGGPTRLAALGMIIGVLSAIAVLLILFYFGLDAQVLRLLSWLDQQGIWGPLLFIPVMALVVVLLIPSVLFTTGAGFAFGAPVGSACVVIGTTLGSAVAFMIARHLFGERASKFILQHARLGVMDCQLAHHDWKVVMLTKLIPFFPSKLANYLFGLTRFSLRGFVGGTFLGIIPFSVHNAYLGSIAADLATKGLRHAERTPLQWTLYGLGFVLVSAAVFYLYRLARQALAEEIGEDPAGAPRCRG